MTPLEPLKGWLFWVVKKPSSGEEGWREGKRVQVPGPLEGPGGVFLQLHVALPSPTSQEVDTKGAAQGPLTGPGSASAIASFVIGDGPPWFTNFFRGHLHTHRGVAEFLQKEGSWEVESGQALNSGWPSHQSSRPHLISDHLLRI